MALMIFTPSAEAIASNRTRGFQPVVREPRWSWRGEVCRTHERAQELANKMADSLTFDVGVQLSP